jgi:hypothetical protein
VRKQKNAPCYLQIKGEYDVEKDNVMLERIAETIGSAEAQVIGWQDARTRTADRAPGHPLMLKTYTTTPACALILGWYND